MNKKVGRPLHGKNRKVNSAIRLDPHLKKFLIKRYGTLQESLDACIMAKLIEIDVCGNLPKKLKHNLTIKVHPIDNAD